ncbi:protein Z, vitamin K-dependent plasma glycoprotein b isoform X2 [Dunckerocampus dactyliophorus]|uniref:protein Z, vitamin K-dependent plasma glycoprotein b isoform X2 n=1 Tax=Dunckerocampus dactyliophorus TaxID=161453 RepID=UPI0024077092|nr:protein Z, vitamin K-dependent plasma glycoprotein b isoform X2 [Dunckerocampus dactyliophorus]
MLIGCKQVFYALVLVGIRRCPSANDINKHAYCLFWEVRVQEHTVHCKMNLMSTSEHVDIMETTHSVGNQVTCPCHGGLCAGAFHTVLDDRDVTRLIHPNVCVRALSIMAVCVMFPRMSLLWLTLLACSLQALGQGNVFVRAPAAQSIFLRSKRANLFFVEEILQGNLERECYEELCSYEEAMEYFEDSAKTLAFWTIYSDKHQCLPNPCLHGGNCTIKVGGFHCSCTAPHHGSVCELGAQVETNSQEDEAEALKAPRGAGMVPCPTKGPGVCHQLCTVSSRNFSCSCVAGFKLQSDGQTCLPEVEFPCGRLPGIPTTGPLCHHGDCPWQALLLDSGGAELCAGVLLGQRSVLIAASCLLQEADPHPSNFLVVTGNKGTLMSVKAFYIHKRYLQNHHDNNLAFVELASPLPLGTALIHLCLPTKDFSENILMYPGRAGVATSMNQNLDQNLVYTSLDECRRQLNVSLPLNNKMFCMKSPSGPIGMHNQTQMESLNEPQTEGRPTIKSRARQCGGLVAGMPVATMERGTAFLTGLLILPPKGCPQNGLAFTKVSRYLAWIRLHLEAAENHMTTQAPESNKTN